jgi:DNA replication protein DnaC
MFAFEVFGVIKRMHKICACEAAAEREMEEEQKAEERKLYLERLFKQSRLGGRFKGCTFDNYKRIPGTAEAFQGLKDYATDFSQNKHRSILLSSTPGTGKTFLASAVVNELIRQGMTAIFVVVPDLLNSFRASYNDENESEARLMHGLTECQLLVLDDLGAERHKGNDDWATEKLFSIINNRYNSMRATIFTTNCNLGGLKLKLGDRTFSRIIEMTDGLRFELKGVPDLRIRKELLG